MATQICEKVLNKTVIYFVFLYSTDKVKQITVEHMLDEFEREPLKIKKMMSVFNYKLILKWLFLKANENEEAIQLLLPRMFFVFDSLKEYFIDMFSLHGGLSQFYSSIHCPCILEFLFKYVPFHGKSIVMNLLGRHFCDNLSDEGVLILFKFLGSDFFQTISSRHFNTLECFYLSFFSEGRVFPNLFLKDPLYTHILSTFCVDSQEDVVINFDNYSIVDLIKFVVLQKDKSFLEAILKEMTDQEKIQYADAIKDKVAQRMDVDLDSFFVVCQKSKDHFDLQENLLQTPILSDPFILTKWG